MGWQTLDTGGELIAMIAEEKRLRDISDPLHREMHRLIGEQAPEVRRDLYERLGGEDRLPEPLASLCDKAHKYEEAAEAIACRIEAATPKTIAGVIALIEYVGGDDNPVVVNAVAGLRQIAARGGVA